MLALNKTIAYTKSWTNTIKTSIVLGFFIAMLLIFLGPFGTSFDTFPYKNIKLAGYALCFIFPIVCVHVVENSIYKKQNSRWFIWNEILYVILVLFLVLLFSFFYHYYTISAKNELSTRSLIGFVRHFGLPFTPVFVPIWVYLRSKFGTIEILETKTLKSKSITIQGENKSESFNLLDSDFIFAQAQQNYVVINYKVEDDVDKKMIRSTLSNLAKQLPNAWQVHRSYLVNLDFLKSVEGNARKRFLTLTIIEEDIPVSQKYYDALKNKLSNSSQNHQE